MGIKSFIPGTAAYSQKHFVKYLRKKASGHDVLMFVEWADGTMSELGADYHPDKEGWYIATNGLVFANVGEGIDPVNYYGVNVIKCHASIGCPFSTEACIQSEYDEAGEFETVSEDGKTIKVQELDRGPSAASANGSQNGEVATDGGGTVKREYDIRPPAGAIGHAFGLTQAKQRAPNAISAMDLRKAIEIGKQSERDNGALLKVAAAGAAGAVVIILLLLGFQWLLGQLGGGGGGGGGTLMPSMLLLSVSTTCLRDELGAAKRKLTEATEADGSDA